MALGEPCATEFQRDLEDGTQFPIVLNPRSEQSRSAAVLAEDVATRREWLKSMLVRSGAILLRGFQVKDAQDFNLVVEAWGGEEYDYIQGGGAAARTRVLGRIVTVNDNLPLEQDLGFHNEAFYLPEQPSELIFFCETPPPGGTGGETPLIHGSVVCNRVHKECPGFVDKSLYGIVRVCKPGHKQPFATAHPSKLPFAVDRAGRKTWYNSIGSYALNGRETSQLVKGADGEAIPNEEIDAIVKIMEEEKVVFRWQAGDVLIVDNTAVQHMRNGCTFADRRILVSLFK